MFLAKGAESRSVEAVGRKIVADAEVSFGPKPNLVTAGDYTFFAGSRSDAFFFDFDGIKNLFDIRGKRNFTEPHLTGKSPWTGVDSNTEANVFSMAVELPVMLLMPGARSRNVRLGTSKTAASMSVRVSLRSSGSTYAPITEM